MLIEFGRSPSFVGPRGLGVAPHSDAVIGRTVDQKLGEVEFLFYAFHTNALGTKTTENLLKRSL